MHSYKSSFSRFFEADSQRLHFAAHSHHPWPDVTFEAHQQAWLDATQHVDDKWNVVLGQVWPEAQKHIAQTLSLPDHESIVFAPNTHEFVLRLLSCFDDNVSIVTSDSEFHSFERQIQRLEETTAISVTRVATEPFESLEARLLDTVYKVRPQLVFLSQVFFNSGAALRDLSALIEALPSETVAVIDGYHGFLARPTDLSRVGMRAFYLSGGYKYAMSGEGVCFLHVPDTAHFRPANTGWWASFGTLHNQTADRVNYGTKGQAFMGATFDPSGLYRFNAVMRWRHGLGLTPSQTLERAHRLQRQFVDGLSASKNMPLSAEQLVVPLQDEHRGQFLTFRTHDASALCEALKQQRVLTDARADRLRFGFGLYHDQEDVERLVRQMHDSLGRPDTERARLEATAKRYRD